MVLIWPSSGGVGGRGASGEGVISRASRMKSLQHAEVAAQVTRPMCPSTALICCRLISSPRPMPRHERGLVGGGEK